MADATITLKLYEVSTGTTAGSVTTLPLANQIGVVCVKAPTDPQQGTIRLYRRGGSLTSSWFQSGSDYPITSLVPGACGAGFYTISDNVADSSLGVQVTLDNDVPISSVSGTAVPLPFIWGPFDNRVLGCGDVGRPDAVYFSKKGNADAWGPQQWVTVTNPSDPVVMGCVYNNRCFAFSYEAMYELVLGLIAGATFTPFPTPCTHGLISPWALCVRDAIYFVAKDGVYRTGGGQEESIVENSIRPLFPTMGSPGRSVFGYEAVDITQVSLLKLIPHNDEIYFTYAGVDTGTLQTLIYDIRKKRWRAAQWTPSAASLYSEPGTVASLLLGGDDGILYQSTSGIDATSNIVAHVRTGAHDQGTPLSEKEYSSVLFDLDPGGATVTNPITITPYINGEAVTESSLTVTGSGRQQVALSLTDVIAYNIEFDISWTRTATINPVLYQYDILWKPEPTGVSHWEARETSHGLHGWQHVRDMYVAIRSNAVVTMQLTFDGGSPVSYTIPSTAGLRKKVYIPLQSNKFKVVRYQFDSADGSKFKLYVEDSEVMAKPWVTILGYTPRKPFGAESQLAAGDYASFVETGGN